MKPENNQKQYQFGDFRLDAGQHLLLHREEVVKLTQKSFELLLYFVQHDNRVIGKETLMKTVWQETFVEDANLTVHISHLRKVFREYSVDAARIETFPKAGYRLVANVVELNAPPSSAGQPGIEALSVAGSGFNNAIRLAIRTRPVAAVLTLIILFSMIPLMANFSLLARSNASRGISSIAVLPFVNESNDPELEYLADGLTESSIRGLSGVYGLSVKSRSTVFNFKNKSKDPVTFGKEIAAQVVLIGRVYVTGNTLSVNYELVNTDTGNVIVSDGYERDKTELLWMQSTMLSRVIQALRPSLSDSGEQRSKLKVKNPETYDLYLRGRFYLNRRTNQDVKTAIGFFQRTIEIDPDFALAYSGLADSYSLLVAFGGMSPLDAMPQAKAAALRAVQLDDGLAEAHASLSNVLPSGEETDRELQRAIELNPSYASAHQWYAESLGQQGRFDEARVEIRRAIELDPLSRIMKNIDGRISLWSGHYDEAIAIFKKNIDLDPTWGGDHDLLFHAYAAKGMYPEAVDAYLAAWSLLKALSPAEAQNLREAFRKSGWEGFLRYRLKSLEEQSKTEYVRPMMLAEFYSRLKQYDKAFDCLNRALENQPGIIGWLKYMPSFDNIRIDPRYTDLKIRYDGNIS